MAPELSLIHLAASSLRAARWDEYEAQVKAAYRVGDDEVWAQLAKHHPATVNLFSALSSQPASNRVAACRWLLPSLGRVSDISVADATILLRFANSLDPSFRYMPAEQLRPHVTARPELGKELGDHLVSEDVPGEASINVWAGAFASGAPKAAASYAKQLVAGAPCNTRLLAILTSYLPTDCHDVEQVLASFESSLTDTLTRSTAELGVIAWTALCQIADYSTTARSALRKALDAVVPDAIVAIAHSLRRRDLATTGVTGAPLDQLVSRLLQVGLIVNEARAHIDAALDGFFFQENLRPIITQCTMKLGAVERNVVEAFPEVFGALANHPPEFASILTDWLLRQDSNFASLNSLLSMCTVSRAPVVLNEAAFVAQGSERRVKAARRLLAFVHHGPTLCQFCALIGEMSALGAERFDLAGQMLDKVFLEYPGATEDFLRAKTSTLLPNAPEVHVFQEVYANVLQWRNILERLPNRKELRPSDAELQVLRARKRRINREILRIAAKESVLAPLCTSVHMAQGRSFASHTSFGPPQIVPMAETSHFVELPSSERADPMRGQIERINLLRNAR